MENILEQPRPISYLAFKFVLLLVWKEQVHPSAHPGPSEYDTCKNSYFPELHSFRFSRGNLLDFVHRPSLAVSCRTRSSIPRVICSWCGWRGRIRGTWSCWSIWREWVKSVYHGPRGGRSIWIQLHGLRHVWFSFRERWGLIRSVGCDDVFYR